MNGSGQSAPYRTAALARARQVGPAAAVLVLALLFVSEAGAQASVPAEGAGSWTLAYQSISVHDHTDYLGVHNAVGKTQSQVLFLGLDYGLTDKLAVSAGVPYIKSKYVGAFPHVHGDYPGHQDEPLIDDGQYHGGLQDYSLGLRYQLWTEPVLVTPFVSFGYPSRDYTFRGHSAIGTRLWHVELGAGVARQFEPPWDDFYVQARYGYSIREKTQGIGVRSSKLDLELGYTLTPRLSARLLAVWLKTHNGLNVPVDFPPAPNPLGFEHDRLLKTESVNLGGGLAFMLNRDYTLFGTWFSTVTSKNAHAIHNAFAVGIGRSF